MPAANPPIAGKLIGAVGLTFGILALGTCWLSLVESIFGWVGIAVGALGLLVGITGLVVAALQNASGLMLNVAAATSGLFGLVVSVVLGIQSGMFAKPEPPLVAAAPIVVQTPPPPPPKVEEPKPEPELPPEPVWTDASQPIEQGPIRATITSAAIEQVRLESANPLSMAREKAAPYLHVRVQLENISTDKIVTAPGWMGARRQQQWRSAPWDKHSERATLASNWRGQPPRRSSSTIRETSIRRSKRYDCRPRRRSWAATPACVPGNRARNICCSTDPSTMSSICGLNSHPGDLAAANRLDFRFPGRCGPAKCRRPAPDEPAAAPPAPTSSDPPTS